MRYILFFLIIGCYISSPEKDLRCIEYQQEKRKFDSIAEIQYFNCIDKANELYYNPNLCYRDMYPPALNCE